MPVFLFFSLGLLAGATHGPRNGSLIIIGGGAFGQEIWDRFFALAGGKDQPVVVIPTAGDADKYGDTALAAIRKAGGTHATLLHTRDRKVADSKAFVEPLRKARGVFFQGGRQWRLADAYLGTRTERELKALLARGGVIAGSSAGATIIGSFMVRGAVSGNEVMVSPGHVRAMGFLSDRRSTDTCDNDIGKNDRPVINERPKLLGIGLDELTAIVVHGDEFEVVGPSKWRSYAGIRFHSPVVSHFGLAGSSAISKPESQSPKSAYWSCRE